MHKYPNEEFSYPRDNNYSNSKYYPVRNPKPNPKQKQDKPKANIISTNSLSLHNNKFSNNSLISDLRRENIKLNQELNEKNQSLANLKLKFKSNQKKIADLEKVYNELVILLSSSGENHKNEEDFNNIFNNYNDILLNDQMEEEIAIKAVEQQIVDELCPNPDAMSYEQLLQLEDKVGHVNKGLTRGQIQLLPLIRFNKREKIYKDNCNCIICMEEFKENSELRKLPCDHLFHPECIDQWLLNEKNCPFCKAEIR